MTEKVARKAPSRGADHRDSRGTAAFQQLFEKEKRIVEVHENKTFDEATFVGSNPNTMTIEGDKSVGTT